MNVNLGRLNNAILGFALICVVLAVAAAYYFACYTLEDPVIDRSCYSLFRLTIEQNDRHLRRRSFDFMGRYSKDSLQELGQPLGLCYVYAFKNPRMVNATGVTEATAAENDNLLENDRAFKKEFAWINDTLISVRNDETPLKNHLESIAMIPANPVQEIYKLSATRRDLIDIVWPLPHNAGILRMGFLASKVHAYQDDLRQNLIIVGITVMLITSIGVLGLNRSVNKRVRQVVFENQERIRLKTKNEVLAEVKKAQRAEARKADDAPLDSNEFFGLLDFAKKVSGTLEIEDIFRHGVGTLVRVMGVHDVMMYMVDDAGENLQAYIGHDHSGLVEPDAMADISVQVGHGDVGQVAEYGGTTIIDVPTPGAAIASAIVSRGQVLGVFRCKSKVNGKPFGRRDKLICRQVSEILGNALYNVILYINKE